MIPFARSKSKMGTKGHMFLHYQYSNSVFRQHLEFLTFPTLSQNSEKVFRDTRFLINALNSTVRRSYPATVRCTYRDVLTQHWNRRVDERINTMLGGAHCIRSLSSCNPTE
ncbi:hypothetical protein XENORESO_017298 [Xenotaenia resolanae]|uniref:Uncharacterized protein n=1 Tax=Xenotaenia resolanae TaxID=208358 RepID=A0ABV0WL25_9TELE